MALAVPASVVDSRGCKAVEGRHVGVTNHTATSQHDVCSQTYHSQCFHDQSCCTSGFMRRTFIQL